MLQRKKEPCWFEQVFPNKQTKNHARKRVTAHSRREQGVTAEEEQHSTLSLRDFPLRERQ